MKGIGSVPLSMFIGVNGCEASDEALGNGTTPTMSVGAN